MRNSEHTVNTDQFRALGTGTYFSIGATVAQAGPGGALVIYGITAVFVLAVVTCLTEMAAYLPHSGAFQHYAERLVSPGFVSIKKERYIYAYHHTNCLRDSALELIITSNGH